MDKSDVDTVIKIRSSAIQRESTSFIQRVSQDGNQLCIYVSSERDVTLAKTFIQKTMSKHWQSMTGNYVKYMIKPTGAQFVMDNLGHSAAITDDYLRSTDLVESGSAIIDQNTNSHGTVGALMYEHGQNNRNIWIVTVGHTFICKVSRQHQPDHISTNSNAHLSSLLDTWQLVGNSYNAAMENVFDDDPCHFVDLAIVPLDSRILNEERYNMDIPGTDRPLSVFSGDDELLVGCTVIKTGAKTGRTTGRIISASFNFDIEGHQRVGLIAMVAHNMEEGKPFAQLGDSGSLIIIASPLRNEAIGLVSAVHNGRVDINGCMYSNVTFCIRLDRCLHYIERHWNKVLSFNAQVMTDPQIHPPHLAMDHSGRINRFMNDARYFTDQYLDLQRRLRECEQRGEMHRRQFLEEWSQNQELRADIYKLYRKIANCKRHCNNCRDRFFYDVLLN